MPKDILRYGFLDDVSVEILATAQSTVVEILEDSTCRK